MSGYRTPSTWWARAWLEAMEAAPGADPMRLARGRQYAGGGNVLGLHVRRGSITGRVEGSRGSPYGVSIEIRSYGEPHWEMALDDAGSALDGDLTVEAVAALRASGIDLLPEPGHVAPRCSCPDLADWCKHAAAVYYSVAEQVEDDPRALFVVRGAPEQHPALTLLAGTASGVVPAGTVDAKAAFARTPEPLPPLPRPPARPGRPAVLGGDPPNGTVRPGDLQSLAADAAVRAWQVLTEGGDGGLRLDRDQDLVRRAATVAGTPAADAMARRAGVAPSLLSRRATAWRYGGAGALAVLDDEWTPDYVDLAEGTAALGGGSHVSRNRVSDAADKRQLRLGRDRLWYPFRRVAKAWEMSGPPAADPRELV